MYCKCTRKCYPGSSSLSGLANLYLGVSLNTILFWTGKRKMNTTEVEVSLGKMLKVQKKLTIKIWSEKLRQRKLRPRRGKNPIWKENDGKENSRGKKRKKTANSRGGGSPSIQSQHRTCLERCRWSVVMVTRCKWSVVGWSAWWHDKLPLTIVLWPKVNRSHQMGKWYRWNWLKHQARDKLSGNCDGCHS